MQKFYMIGVDDVPSAYCGAITTGGRPSLTLSDALKCAMLDPDRIAPVAPQEVTSTTWAFTVYLESAFWMNPLEAKLLIPSM